tara:strand:+ start:107 stop:532 length:426 start_codon:yes stop_codon:yes gene_type:complete
MSILDSLTRSIKNVFVGSHRGDDFILDSLEEKNSKKSQEKMTKKVNDLGVDPNEWFEDDKKYDPPVGEYLPEVDDWFSTPHNEKEEEITMHEKMYRMATARYNPFSIGGSENCDSDISCVGGSENHMEDPPDLAPCEYEPP